MAVDGDARSTRDPEALLRQVEAAERAEHRGQLKIFLGYTSGVGKSFKLFDEGRRRRERGEDVVVAAMQPDSTPTWPSYPRRSKLFPRRTLAACPSSTCPRSSLGARRSAWSTGSRTTIPQEADTETLSRMSTNCSRPASRCSPRSISNTSPSSRTSCAACLGTTKTETVPQEFINRADEVVVVDAPPEADAAVEAQQLSQLRQRALLLTADVVDRQLEAYLLLNGIQSSWGTQERILVCMTPRANAAKMLASGRRTPIASTASCSRSTSNSDEPDAGRSDGTGRNATLARAQQAHVDVLEGKDPIKTILDYARTHGITQIFVGHNLRRPGAPGSAARRSIA